MHKIFEGLNVKQINKSQDGTKITWIATYPDTKEEIIIKQISSLTPNHVLSGIDIYKKKIKYLQAKNYSFIFKYLGVFAGEDSFYILREYKKNVMSLAQLNHIKLEDIKTIATKMLSILIELQESNTPVIHQNLKPENIFIDKKLNLYLTDFGFSEVMTYSIEDFSSEKIGKELTGFVAPEQFIKPVKASDLYALGATLICLITKTKSQDLYKLTDRENKYRINFQDFVMGLRPRFIEWLEKMVAPDQRNRFKNAKEALSALNPLYVTKYPEVKISHEKLNITITNLQEKHTEIITVTNSIRNTILQGEWSVSFHTSDPPHSLDNHSWIEFNPRKFAHNNMECKITIDSSKLMADKIYKREIILKTNTAPNVCNISLEVITPPISLQIIKPPYLFIFIFFMSSFFLAIMGGFIGILANNIGGLIASVGAWFLAAFLISFSLTGVYLSSDTWSTSRYLASIIGGLFSWTVVLAFAFIFLQKFGSANIYMIAMAQFILIFISTFMALLGYVIVDKFKEKGLSKKLGNATVLLTLILGIFMGIGSFIGFFKIYLLIPLVLLLISLGIILIYPVWQELKLIKKYRELEKKQLLIEP